MACNLLNDDVVASLGYAVSVLNTPLIVLFGHQACGAVDAAIKSIKDSTALPGQPNDVLTVIEVKSAAPILSKAVEGTTLFVVGGVYGLPTAE